MGWLGWLGDKGFLGFSGGLALSEGHVIWGWFWVWGLELEGWPDYGLEYEVGFIGEGRSGRLGEVERGLLVGYGGL